MKKQSTVCVEAETYGIDRSLIQSNLRLTPTERLRRHNKTLNTMKKLRDAMEKKRG